MIGFGVIGYGYWGPNLVRNLAEASGVRLVTVCDIDADRRALAAKRYPFITTVTDARELIWSPDVDVVVIATPVATHFELGMAALAAGKHVLLEKPMAASVDEASRLIDAAERAGRLLMVDHSFLYAGAVRKLRQVIDSGHIGSVSYYDSMRVNLGLFQTDVDVLWDLAVHDLSILAYLIDAAPVAVSANGLSHVEGRPENIAYLTLFFDQPMIAHINVNWLAPVKVRRTLIGGTGKMIVYDELEPSEKVKIYDSGITVQNVGHQRESLYDLMIGYRTGDMWAPRLDGREALATEVDHLVDCLTTGQRPLSDGVFGLNVVRGLEAATRSMRERGRPVDL